VGECLAIDPATADVPDGQMPIVVACDQPHLTEVFSEVTLGTDPSEPYPGDEQVYYRAMELCSGPFLSFIGVSHSESSIGLQVHRPMQQSWDAGARSARCLAIVTDGEVVGTLQGANR
jgi:hypothetical protein